MISSRIPEHRIAETYRTFQVADEGTRWELLLVMVPKLNTRGGDIAIAAKRDGAIKPIRWFEQQGEAEAAFDGAVLILRHLGLEKD